MTIIAKSSSAVTHPESAVFLSDTTASQLMIDQETAGTGIPKIKGKTFDFYLDMTNGEPDSVHLKYFNQLTNYSGVSHNDFIRNSVS